MVVAINSRILKRHQTRCVQVPLLNISHPLVGSPDHPTPTGEQEPSCLQAPEFSRGFQYVEHHFLLSLKSYDIFLNIRTAFRKLDVSHPTYPPPLYPQQTYFHAYHSLPPPPLQHSTNSEVPTPLYSTTRIYYQF